MAMKKMTMDGNMAAAWVSYAFTETAGIYPITPSSDMAQYTDEWAAGGKKNMFGEPVKVVEMQSEGGAAGVVHGSLQAGALTTTYTASQGLLLMVPNMYKIAGELLPCVFHVSARNIATHALSIFGEHSDVYAARQTGFAMLASGGVQEAMDLGAVAHLASIKSKVPFLHFFDGFRTSHEIQKIDAWDYEDLANLVDRKAVKEFRENALNPENPVTRGSAQNPDIYFQVRESSNKYYDAVPAIVEDYMKEVSKLCGRDYAPFNYYGAADADRVIVAMGSVTSTIRETVDYLNAKGEKVGAIIVRLFRPFSAKHFLTALPKTCKKISVLDRSKECGALGEPLYLDVRTALFEEKDAPIVVGGRYGLSSKDTTPAQIVSVYENLNLDNPKNQFSLGIVDDVTHQSLEIGPAIDTVPEGTVECKFFGLGADGTVGANKNSIKIIGDNTDMFAQGYFSYDSKKSGGVTVSHLRFGKKEIMSTYLVTNPNFVSCSVPSYLDKYDMLEGLKPGGSFLLNSIWDEKEVLNHVPAKMKKYMAENDIKFYILNATKIANEIGLGTRTNTIMQSAFFKLAEVIPYDQAVDLMKKAIFKSYSTKGDAIVNMNNEAVDKGASALVQVTVDPAWKDLKIEDNIIAIKGLTDSIEPKLAKFVKEIATPVNLQQGDKLPVSTFVNNGNTDGTLPSGTSQFEKRDIAVDVPEWLSENCIQCNQCAYVCPHAVIRPFLLDEEEQKNAPADMKTLKPMGKGMDGLQYRLQVSTHDCTGCAACVVACPAKTKALVMKPLEEQNAKEEKNWDYVNTSVTYKDHLLNKTTVKGSQFAQPLFEFSGACAGCGETPYIKSITQLFGDRMMVANATGCSSIFGASAPATPYRKNSEGHGVAWANSLFEDNAEFGAGMQLGTSRLRERVARRMTEELENVSAEMKAAFTEYLDTINDVNPNKAASKKAIALLEKEGGALAEELLELKQYFVKKSCWVFGGDGWAYDIGYGGLDHVLASGEDINVLVMDTEVYSNTGGQSSKASPTGSVAKFAASGKKIKKKDLGLMAMSYGYVYVAQVSMGASQAQFLKAIAEAEAYPGPSLVIAYSPCIAHGIKGGMANAQNEMKFAVESGYWHLYRYNPTLEEQGVNPFKLESKAPDFDKYLDFLNNEVRYTTLKKQFPEEAERLFAQAVKDAKWKYKQYKLMNEMDYSDKE